MVAVEIRIIWGWSSRKEKNSKDNIEPVCVTVSLYVSVEIVE